MKEKKLLYALGGISDDYIEEAFPTQRKRPAWRRLTAIAACLCLFAGIFALALPQETSPAENPADAALPPYVVHEGCRYIISSRIALSESCPEGFVFGGESAFGEYYVNQDMPEWVYVYQEVYTNGQVDASGTLERTEPHMAYVRYVDERIRGRDFVSVEGEIYISLWSAQTYGDRPDVRPEAYDTALERWDIRIEEARAPEGLQILGTAAFSGWDSVPQGKLFSNTGTETVAVLPDTDEVVFVSTEWYTAAADENGETRHTGWNVYIRWEGNG